jgi:hypothetical protein
MRGDVIAIDVHRELSDRAARVRREFDERWIFLAKERITPHRDEGIAIPLDQIGDPAIARYNKKHRLGTS